ncbi:MAG: chitobiase/beta-hexosaminidase C-terminal domain-containing protein [Paludibacteraceae bacterium]|nr:chitobiase/beta-hexosaminidase C-terminal domain-containing protein [Paludibacteraceae bacterium]
MKKSFYFLSVFFVFSSFYAKSQAPSQCTDVMLQAFYWDSYADSKWSNLTSQASELAGSFDLVWLPPSGNANSPYYNTMGYSPVYYFNQNSSFGTQTELKTLISTLKNAGTRCVADIVINHRNGVSSWTDFPSETYNGVTYTWGSWAICNNDECVAKGYPATGGPDEGENFDGARDLDHRNVTVQNTIKAYMQFLKNDIGYAGWRYDMTKGYPGSYNAMYNDAANADYSVGEYWDGSYDALWNWIKAANYKSTTFDFSFKYALNNFASAGGDFTKLVWLYNGAYQPAGLIHHPDSKRYATTFIDNHDTYRDSNKFNGDVLLANAFMLCSPGIPCVSLPHWKQYKNEIKAMIAARHAVGIHSESAVTVNQVNSGSYVATVVGKKGSLMVKLGSGSYAIPSDYTLAASGNNYAIYTKGGSSVPVLTVSPNSGTYYYGQTVTMSATGNAAIYYTTDGSTPTTSSTRYTSPFTLPIGNTTVKAIAVDASQQTSKMAEYNYTIVEKPTAITVRFTPPPSWTSYAVYVWEMVNGNAVQLAGVWPGTVVSKDAQGYVSYTITNFTQPVVNVIFNNNNKKEQTVDLSTSENICWTYGTSSVSGSNTVYSCTVDPSCITAVEQHETDTWKIYPNPTRGIVYLSVTEEVEHIMVTSALGVTFEIPFIRESNVNKIDLSNFPAGIYYVGVYGKNGSKQTGIVLKN